MVRKGFVITGMVLLLASWLTTTAWGGGWVAVTLDTLPMALSAGERLTLGFMLRQHGLHPVGDNWDNQPLKPVIWAKNKETDESVMFEARQEGEQGHFVVEIIFPTAGTWQWGVKAEPWFTFPENFEPITVAPAAPIEANTGSLLREGVPGWSLIGLALVLAGGLALAVQRGRLTSRLGISLGLLGGVLIAGIFWGPALVSGASGPANDTAVLAEPDPAYGRALFVAKGCSSCHLHSEISDTVPGPFIGPQLSDYPADPEFIRAWLRAPEKIRPQTQMPNLGLSEAEIEALVAFLKP